jgi:hypothetical protein
MLCMSGFNIVVAGLAFHHNRKTVNVTNVLSGGLTLNATCKSKSDDLGSHVLIEYKSVLQLQI